MLRILLAVSKELEHYPDTVLSWLADTSEITHEVADVLVNSLDETSSIVKNREVRFGALFLMFSLKTILYNIMCFFTSCRLIGKIKMLFHFCDSPFTLFICNCR